ncbi:unnamed protein product [Danaus chrysippus]|uniref:(African queen) hypothetical protein n=1 Tax=Danaus chrysippus TaxID=151541 RepID=A0A8J2QGJ6_9NEOP|nr:unnamed protein product [Danaus chrysippus]
MRRAQKGFGPAAHWAISPNGSTVQGYTPTTFRKDAVDLDEVPTELYSKSDNRRFNRLMCKTDLVQWYIHEDGKKVEEDTKRAVKQLFDNNQDRLEKVFNYNWMNAKFKIGNINLSRALVPVNPNNIDIPKELIKPTILHSLGLSNLVEYENIPKYYLDQIQKIVAESNLDVRKIPSLLNYNQSQIDKRYRYLPILSGLTLDFIYITHALVQPQYRVSNLMEYTSQEKGQNVILTSICINLIRHCQEREKSPTTN